MPATPASPGLPAPAARLVRLLGLHPGPDIGLNAAAALAGTGIARTRQHLDMLVGALLLRQTAPDRYEIRADAAGPAQPAGTAEAPGPDQAEGADQAGGPDRAERADGAALRRVLDWYLHTADAAQRLIVPAEPRLPLDSPPPDGVTPLTFPDPGPDRDRERERDRALDWSELEQHNLLAAARAAARTGLDAHAWRLCVAGWILWRRSGPVGEWMAAARDGLAAVRRLGDRAAEAWLLACLGEAHAAAHRPAEGEECHREALRLRHALGDRLGEARSVNALGRLRLRRRQLREARESFEEALAAFRELGHRHGEAAALAGLAGAYHAAGRLAEAEDRGAAALAAYRALDEDDPGGEADALGLLSAIRRERGTDAEAEAGAEAEAEALNAARRAVELALLMRDRVLEARVLLALGEAQAAADGLLGEALASYQRSAALHRRLGDRGGEALAWHGTGDTYRRMGRGDEAAAFHGQAAAVHRELGDRWNEAVALAGLAAALEGDDPDRAARNRADALRLTTGYHDPRALALRQRCGAPAGR
ncbi:tetratricopeptide repeat protein [Streptomyces sp. 6N223]|uniref:tetratricopeptide repeat protein n=1 Tax=Streptomyces sp. 6N223 TaxID=3457412 RepID=UPI003FCFF24E